MSDTRRDKRAPVALKVRYKSATVNQFLEHYSEDISRGGTFIKSKKPMAVGTLLKFELQLQDESRLIHGVGRVVWKREVEDASESKPPGMGIKFIKMDADSRALVQKILDTRGDAPGRFEGDAAADGNGASTSAGEFFPSTTPEDEMPPPEDRTAVRHASEFLAEALADTDGAAATEARAGAEEARKRTEEIERARAESLRPEAADTVRRDADAAAPETVRQDVGTADTLLVKPPAEDVASPGTAEAGTGPSDADTADGPGAEDARGEAEGAGDNLGPEAAADTPGAGRPTADDARPATAARGADAPREPRSKALPMAVALVAVGLVVYLVLSNTGLLGGPSDADMEAAVAVDEVDLVAEPPPVDEPAAAEPEPEPEPADVPRVAVPVQVEGKVDGPVTFLVDGTEVGDDLDAIELPIGEAATVRAVALGHTSEPQTITATEDGNPPLTFELVEMPYMLMVETEPPGVRVRAGGGTVTTPGRLRVRRPTDPVVVTATRRGFQPVRQELPLSEFRADESEGEMQATLELELQPATPAPKAPPKAKGETPTEPKEAKEPTEPKEAKEPTEPKPAAEPEAPPAEPKEAKEPPQKAPAEPKDSAEGE
jgi:uncharacterized protein (TIGR02266 family)